jgi:sterol desaturase/sphingolipid hydroxylase (fatty acid hydroxylase superfamily)
MEDHWLVRETTIKRLWTVFTITLAATVLLDLVIHPHPYFGLDGTFGFGAWFGFVSCVGLIILASALGRILKRPDTYYDR